MGLTTTFLMAFGLAMDAFAASIADGATASRHRISRAVQLAVVFAVFQAAMPLIGWAIGRGFAGPIQDVDHWVAFGLLGIIGLRMIHADMTPSDTDVRPDGWQSLILVALATSIDALAAGLSLTFLDSIITPVVVIGLVTFGLCFIGVELGSRYRRLAAGRVQTVGGVILILIGTKILIEHLGLA